MVSSRSGDAIAVATGVEASTRGRPMADDRRSKLEVNGKLRLRQLASGVLSTYVSPAGAYSCTNTSWPSGTCDMLG